MQLGDWLEREGVAPEAFGARIGVTGQTIRNWRDGKHTPGIVQALAVEQATGGEVRPVDWLTQANAQEDLK